MMKKSSATNLIQETLQGSFNKERFVYLIKNILNHVEEAPFTYKGNYIFDDFADSIKTVDRIGKYKDPEEKLVDILIVYLRKETSLERARTKQRNFVAKYLKGSRGGVLKDAALVAFVSPGGDDWRFSLVKMEYKFNEKGKVEEEFTPARRYSFLVGKKENSHTAQSRLMPLLLDDEVNPSLNDLENVFSVERVTKEFFEKYRDLFLRLKESLDEIVKKDAKVEADLKQKNVETVDFSKKLLGQIVFLYFLQKKGWFGVKRGDKWGLGSKKFLRELFDKKHGDYKNYFNDILEPLFYEALRLERPGDYYSRFDCRIPFLNGGLFDPINDYDWWDTDIILPDDVFSNSRKTKEGDTGDGILDIFDRFNFTVKEDEPLEKEVAVDPEMLGKVFENLLEVRNRKSKGTYYTPREIVHYMCQESLTNYLINELEGKVNREDVETLIKYGETVVEHDSRVMNEGRETKTYAFKLSQSVRNQAEAIDRKLSSIRVCDPAVGSGAFPVGMMNEIVRARNALTPYIGVNGKRSPYHFKRQAIQYCLYGVDIDPGAVEICKLRLWLSLVVDEETREKVQPLPNLDYKIVQGNSLLSVEKNLLNLQLFNQLEELKPLYFNETSASNKQKFKKQIDELINQITDGHENFDFEVYFSEVMHEKNGFDVVIANPPYAGERKNKHLFHDVQKDSLGKFYLGRMDYFYFFLHLALELGKEKSQHAFITTDYYITALGGRKLRADLKERSVIRNLINFNELRIFESARGQHNMITIFSKDGDAEVFANSCIVHRIGDANEKILRDIVTGVDNQTEYHQIKQEHIYEGEEQYIRLNGSVDFGSGIQSILGKMQKETNGITLKDVANPIIGLESSADAIYIVNNVDIPDIIKSPEEANYIKPFFKNSNIKRYHHEKISERSILYLHEKMPVKIETLEGIWSYLNKNKVELKKRKGANLRGAFRRGNWWVLNTPRLNLDFDAPKIITPYRTKKCNFAYCEIPWYASRDVYYITQKDKQINLKYLLALLNSNLYFAWLYNKGKRKGETLELYQKPLSEVPIKKATSEEQKAFVCLVDAIHLITKDDDYMINPTKKAKVKSYEKEIDELVYKLYKLNEDEIRMIEEAGE